MDEDTSGKQPNKFESEKLIFSTVLLDNTLYFDSAKRQDDLTETKEIKALFTFLESIIQNKKILDRTDLFRIINILSRRENHASDNVGFSIPAKRLEILSDLSRKIDYSFDKVPIAGIDGLQPDQGVSFLGWGNQEQRTQQTTENDIRLLKSKFSELDETQKKIEIDLDIKNELLYELLYDKEVDYGIQYLPVSIYLDSNRSSVIFTVYTAVLDFVKSMGFEKIVELKDRKGSWIKKIIAKSLSPLTKEAVTDRLKEAEYGVEVNTILKPLSEVEKNQSEALLNITKSVENAPNAAIRIGSLIVVKLTEAATGSVQIMARTLSIKEVHLLNKKPALLDNPQKLLAALSEVIDKQTDGPLEPNQIN